VSSHGATPAKTGRDASAAHPVGRVKRATIADAEDGRIMPKATPMIIPLTR